MTRKVATTFGRFLLVALVVAVVLFSEALTSLPGPGWLRSVTLEVRAVCRDPGTQWMVFACCAIYFITFTLLGKRGTRSAERGTWQSILYLPSSILHPRAPDLCLCALLLIASLHYALNYATASGSTQALMLIAGAAIGKGVRLWINWGGLGEQPTSNTQHPTSSVGGGECGRGNSTPHPQSLSPIEAEREAECGAGSGESLTTKYTKHTKDGTEEGAKEHRTSNSDKSRAGIQHPTSKGGSRERGAGSEEQARPDCSRSSAGLHPAVSRVCNPPDARPQPDSQLSTLNPQPTARVQLLLAILLLLLSVAALWHPEGAMQFQYRGLNRWSGPWNNPNIFGLLMGVGVVLAAGCVVARFKTWGAGAGKHPTPNSDMSRAGIQHPTSNASARRLWSVIPWSRGLVLVALAACGMVCALGLLKSYSRGAWLGTALGLAVLAFRILRLQVSGSKGRPLTRPSATLSPSDGERDGVKGTLSCASQSRVSGEAGAASTHSPIHSFNLFNRFNSSPLYPFNFLRSNWRPLSIILFSVVIIAFWQFRHTEFHPVRRAFSVGNTADFSWRNRVAAWEGSLAMMADKPLTGFGWNKPERIYDQFYRPPQVSEGMAIQLNHYFILGMSLGLPALLCFAAYIGLSLARGSSVPLLGGARGGFPNRESGPAHSQPSTLNSQLPQACHSAAVVLLVGLWFDGGLFNLATGAIFWVLLELGHTTALPACRGGDPESRLVSTGPSMLPVGTSAVALMVAALGVTALFWAGARDPFHREWLSLKATNGQPFSAVAVMPDRGGPFPVVVWCHGSGGSLESGGETLRQFAALGLAAVGFEYDKTNQANFDAQFAAVLEAVESKVFSTTKHTKSGTEEADVSGPSTLNPQPSTPTAWAGNSLGAQRQLSFLARHPERQPGVLVRLNGGMVEELNRSAERGVRSGENAGEVNGLNRINELHEKGATGTSTLNPQPSTSTQPLAVWIAHGENDEVFPASDARKVAEALRAAGADVQLDVFAGRGHNFGEDQPLLVRRAAEFCARELGATREVPDNVRPSAWFLWVPVGVFGMAILLRRGLGPPISASNGNASRWLKATAVLTCLLALALSAAHLLLPLCHATPAASQLARRWCVQPEMRPDFDWLLQQPQAGRHRLRDLLDHLNLATLQRGKFASEADAAVWRDYVLSPWIGDRDYDITWRPTLWEWLAPRVRRESDAAAAARIVVRELGEEVQIDSGQPDAGISESWASGAANPVQREVLLCAMLRSAGVPSRISATGSCELWSNGQWLPAPLPALR